MWVINFLKFMSLKLPGRFVHGRPRGSLHWRLLTSWDGHLTWPAAVLWYPCGGFLTIWLAQSSSISMGFSLIYHLFCDTSICGNPHIYAYIYIYNMHIRSAPCTLPMFGPSKSSWPQLFCRRHRPPCASSSMFARWCVARWLLRWEITGAKRRKWGNGMIINGSYRLL